MPVNLFSDFRRCGRRPAPRTEAERGFARRGRAVISGRHRRRRRSPADHSADPVPPIPFRRNGPLMPSPEFRQHLEKKPKMCYIENKENSLSLCFLRISGVFRRGGGDASAGTEQGEENLKTEGRGNVSWIIIANRSVMF